MYLYVSKLAYLGKYKLQKLLMIYSPFKAVLFLFILKLYFSFHECFKWQVVSNINYSCEFCLLA